MAGAAAAMTGKDADHETRAATKLTLDFSTKTGPLTVPAA
jgi:hypothetical protein